MGSGAGTSDEAMAEVLRVPGSLASAKVLAPAAVAAATGVTLLEACARGVSELAFGVLLIFVPIITAAVLAKLAAQARWSRLFRAAACGAGVQALGGLALVTAIGGPNPEYAFFAVVAAAFSVAFVAVLALPLVVAAGVIGPRRDLEAGDLMLAVGGLWMAAIQMLKVAAMPEQATTFLLGLTPALLASGIYVGRMLARRAWCARVARGELTGWRVRPTMTGEELDTLPPVFGSPHTVSAVIERVQMGGVLYRSGLLAQPVATMTLREERTVTTP
jgi:hypothetical protein